MPRNCKITDEFRSYTLVNESNPFDELFASVCFEELGKGRKGVVLVKPDDERCIPLVRTTSKYRNPSQLFRPVHETLAQQIQQMASIEQGFNNALIETYTNVYTTMGSHSDQALDLAENSYIALFSCYQHPENAERKLIVESKEIDSEKLAIPLKHNTVIVFSVEANRRFKHKIVLEGSTKTPDNQWLGVTFRTSKTFVSFREDIPYLPDNVQLTLANDEQTQEFYRLRGKENKRVDFTYPPVAYTISKSDLCEPV